MDGWTVWAVGDRCARVLVDGECVVHEDMAGDVDGGERVLVLAGLNGCGSAIWV